MAQWKIARRVMCVTFILFLSLLNSIQCQDYIDENSNLDKIPAGIPSNTRRLYLADNSITAVETSRISHLTQLTDIGLKNNALTAFPDL